MLTVDGHHALLLLLLLVRVRELLSSLPV